MSGRSPQPGDLVHKVHMPDPPMRFDTKDRFEINLPAVPQTLGEFVKSLDGCPYPIITTLVERALVVSVVVQELPSETQVPVVVCCETFDKATGNNDMLMWGTTYRSRKTGRRDNRLVTRYRGRIEVQADAWDGSNASIIPAAVVGRISYAMYDNSRFAVLSLSPVVGWASGSSPVIPVRRLIPDTGLIDERDAMVVPLALYDLGDVHMTVAPMVATGRPMPEVHAKYDELMPKARLRERYVTRLSIIGESGQSPAPLSLMERGVPPTASGVTIVWDSAAPGTSNWRMDSGCSLTLSTVDDVPPSFRQGMISVISSPTGGVTVGVPTSNGVSWKKAYAAGHQLVESPELFPNTGLKQY